jgi:poly(hydroxyalkanoate) depolymerase family esterase
VEVLSRNFEKTFKLSESSVRAAIEIRQHCALHSASPCEHRAFRVHVKYWSALSSLRHFRTLSRNLAFRGRKQPLQEAPSLEEVRSFGSNPGNLKMFAFLPNKPADKSALVVVLHGCGQTANNYDQGAGWSSLASRYGFSLLMPQQLRANNPYRCFSWFQPQDTQRGLGEAASIRQMIEKMVQEDGIDAERIFITGLSAGGAMTSALLACYPEVFDAGAIIAGLPYGAALTARQALRAMHHSPSRTSAEWAEIIRGGNTAYEGPWPRISVWHGNADRTIDPDNADEIVKQWTAVHGLALAPTREDIIDGYPCQSWLNDGGEEIVQSYRIPDMAHGTPLSTGNAESQCGAAGPFLLNVGISSSFHIARFFGLVKAA